MELAYSAAEKPPLFTDDELDPTWVEHSRDIRTTMDVTQKISAIREMEKEIERVEAQDQDSRAFYAQKKAAFDQRMEYLKRQILNYLQSSNRKNIQTPAGMAYQRMVTTRLWPHDDVLLTWCVKNLPDAIRVKSEPDKRVLAERIKATGEIPEGYQELQQTRLYLK